MVLGRTVLEVFLIFIPGALQQYKPIFMGILVKGAILYSARRSKRFGCSILKERLNYSNKIKKNNICAGSAEIEAIHSKLCGNCAFPQKFLSRELDERNMPRHVPYDNRLPNFNNSKKYVEKCISRKINERWVNELAFLVLKWRKGNFFGEKAAWDLDIW